MYNHRCEEIRMQREVNIMIAEYNEYLCGEIKLMCMFMIPTIICASVFIYFIVDTIKRNPFAKKRLKNACKKLVYVILYHRLRVVLLQFGNEHLVKWR